MERQRDMSLQGLLKFAIKHTQSEDAPNGGEPPRQLSDEEKEFLENAMKSMTVDIIEEFRKAVIVLENAESSKQDKLNALNFVREQIDHIDFANSFVKVGGTNILLNIVEHDEDPALRKNAIYTIAEMCQNNEFCQKHFVAVKVIPLLVNLFSADNEDLATSALHAVSALVRNFEPGLVEFLAMGGIHKLIQHFNTPHSRFFTKLCFVVACLCVNETVQKEFVKHDAMSKLYSQLDVVSGFDIRTETLLFAMSEVSKCEDWQPSAEFQAELGRTLRQLVDVNKGLAECEEITMYANNVLTKIK